MDVVSQSVVVRFAVTIAMAVAIVFGCGVFSSDQAESNAEIAVALESSAPADSAPGDCEDELEEDDESPSEDLVTAAALSTWADAATIALDHSWSLRDWHCDLFRPPDSSRL